MKTKQSKQTKRQRILELERKLEEALAGQVHVYHFADAAIDKASTDRLSGSGIIITLTALGGMEVVGPTMIRNGLSKETIEALKGDFRRSYEDAIVFKPGSQKEELK